MNELIRIDYSGCMKDIVGETGVSVDALNALQPKIAGAVASLQAQKKQGKIGFMELPSQVVLARQIQTAAKKVASRFDTFVVVGIGGSALGSRALQHALRHPQWNLLGRKERKGWPRLFVVDNIDPGSVAGLMDVIDVKKTLFNVISKSGETAETLANFFILKKALQKAVGEKYRDHLIVTTDAAKGYLREAVETENYLSFEIPAGVGGRYSVLSPVGLVSAAFTGIDIERLLAGAAEMDSRCATDKLTENPAAMYAALQYLFYWLKRPLSVMMPYADALSGVTAWYLQLWAESLGKKTDRQGDAVYVGPTPVAARGVTDQHAQLQLYIDGPQDKLVTFLSVEDYGTPVEIPPGDDHYLGGHTLARLMKAEEEATRLALTGAGRPNLTIRLPNISPETVGQLLYMLELAAAYAGELFNINAFDQPGVETEKQYAYCLLGRPGFEHRKKEIETQFDRMKHGNYVV